MLPFGLSARSPLSNRIVCWMVCAFCWVCVITGSLWGQASSRPCGPVSEQSGQPGPACFIAKEAIGTLPEGEVFWHLYTFADRAQAEAAKGPRGTVVESLGKIWLFTIAEAQWKPVAGTFVTKIGPLATTPSVNYEAVYMQSIFSPGMTAPLHTHSGVEAFYTLTGETCLETSDGVQRGSGPGHVNLIRGGLPMLLMATGSETRRGVVLILHDASRPATVMENEWKPTGLCKKL
jgi:quercetin dioxygenase-like cupin family protein